MKLYAALAPWFAVLVSCSSSSPPPGSTSAPTGSPPASQAPTASAMPGPTSGGIKGMIVAANACTGIGKPMAASTALVPNGTKLSQKFNTGCGCLQGAAHFTLAYEPKTSPLRVRLCDGPGQDSCEMACSGVLEWDMTTALREAGASSFKLVD